MRVSVCLCCLCLWLTLGQIPQGSIDWNGKPSVKEVTLDESSHLLSDSSPLTSLFLGDFDVAAIARDTNNRTRVPDQARGSVAAPAAALSASHTQTPPTPTPPMPTSAATAEPSAVLRNAARRYTGMLDDDEEPAAGIAVVLASTPAAKSTPAVRIKHTHTHTSTRTCGACTDCRRS